MGISTLLVSDDEPRTLELSALIKSQSQLNLTGTSAGENAAEQILELSPSIVWLELSPDPTKALALLAELRGTYPKIQYLVSYKTLQSDLVKSAMQLGAAEYIDPEGAERLLPDAIKRIVHELDAAILGTPRNRPASASGINMTPVGSAGAGLGAAPPPPPAPSMAPPPPPTPSYGSGAPGSEPIRAASSSGSTPAPTQFWLWPAVAIIIMMVLGLVLAQVLNHTQIPPAH